MKHVLIVYAHIKPIAEQKTIELSNWLNEQGISTYVIKAEDILVNGVFSTYLMDIINDIDLICSLGGDGTLLSCAQIVFKRNIPVLGFNFGTLGFLNGTSPDAMEENVIAALEGKLNTQTRSALDVEIIDIEGKIRRYSVLNEMAITRGLTGSMIRYEIKIDGETLTKMRADGVIVSSPTGSTAYSLSAGGPIVTPTLSCMIVVALAPHSLVSRALVTGENETVTILPDIERDCSVILDGFSLSNHIRPEQISITVRKNALTLLSYNAPSFTRSASRVFFGVD